MRGAEEATTDGDLRRIRSGVEKGVLYFVVAMIYIGRMQK